MRMTIGFFFVVSCSSACATLVAPIDAPDAAIEVAVPAEAAPVTPGVSPLRNCQPERSMSWTDEPGFSTGVRPSYFAVSPNSGLIYRQFGYYREGGAHHRASTGELVFASQSSGIESRDAAWQREVTLDHDSTPALLRVSSTITHRTIFQTGPLRPEQPWTAATLTSDGNTVIAAACLGDHLQVHSWQVDTGQGTGEAAIPGECNSAREYGMQLVAIGDGSSVLVATPRSGTLYRADLRSHTVTHVLAHTAATGDSARILAIALHPDLSRVVTVGTDLTMKTWSLPGLEPAGSPTATGLGRVNENLYAPQYEMSPAAWSDAGDLLAYVTPEGNVALRTTDGRTTATLASPMPTEATRPGQRNPPTQIAFSRQGTFVAVSYEHSLAVWACPGFRWPERRESLGVTLEGTRTMQVGTAGAWTATHMGTDHVHSHQFWIDGIAERTPSTERELHWTAAATGRHTIAVVIDDGIDFGRASLDVDVQP